MLSTPNHQNPFQYAPKQPSLLAQPVPNLKNNRQVNSQAYQVDQDRVASINSIQLQYDKIMAQPSPSIITKINDEVEDTQDYIEKVMHIPKDTLVEEPKQDESNKTIPYTE